MKEMKHTPGPWVCQTQANGSSIRHPVILSDDGAVATAQWCDNTQKTNANARLIAAAPELLEALNAVLRDYKAVHCVGDLEMQPALFQAHAAIDKATGQSK